jgi:hypothetical protein
MQSVVPEDFNRVLDEAGYGRPPVLRGRQVKAQSVPEAPKTTDHLASPPLPTWTAPFRLFDLPSELRLRIYEMALAPTGVLCLSSTKTKRRAVIPNICPALLLASRRIYDEARKVLLEQNEIMITVNAHDTCWPTISEDRLPQRLLERLLHLCVVLDCTEYFNASYADVDFGAFEALTSLKTLRVAMIYRKHYPSQMLAPLHIPQLREFNILAQILERIPASTKLFFGTESGTQQHEVVLALLAMRKAGHSGVVEEALAAHLESAAVGVPGLVRGCKSDASHDVFAESHTMFDEFGQKYGVVSRV